MFKRLGRAGRHTAVLAQALPSAPRRRLLGRMIRFSRALPGQFDQRADSASECIQLISQGERPTVRSAKVYALEGELGDDDDGDGDGGGRRDGPDAASSHAQRALPIAW